MATKGNKSFPKECCGVCDYFHVTDGDNLCFSEPPQICSDGEGFTWLRGAVVDPTDPACIHFKPKCHS
jgi:hypothetical protein